jgi:hypothetical protein
MSNDVRYQDESADPLNRRELLGRCGMGFGLIGLAGIMADDKLLGPSAVLASTAHGPLATKSPHFSPKAKQVVHLFMNGGPSHIDTFDPKPILTKHHGKALPGPNLRTERKTGAALGSPFSFKKFGQSGIEVSELFARTAGQHIDDLCIVRSMYADVPNHEPSLMLMNCGDGRLQRPSMGAWITYGLGSENQNLPGFIAMCPGGYPIVATQNWRSAFLPGAYQGTYIDTQHGDIHKLIENIRNNTANPSEQRRQLDLVRRLNERHAAARPHDPALYGSGTHARQLLITRRLLERGVRFIQVWSGAGQPWDDHENLTTHHRQLAAEWDQAIAAFLTDLKQRGLFEQALVFWGGEFGRTPVAELPALSGRDHNHYGFSMWLAGGGARGGHVHGATDELGFAATVDRVHVHDLHATILHLLGFAHEKLIYRYAGRDFRLTDVHGHVVKELVA